MPEDYPTVQPVRESDYFKHLTPAQRAAILDEYLKEGRPITAICKEYGISRPTFYKWLKRYEEAGKKPAALEDKPWKISYHPKQIPWDLEKKIIHLAIKHPHLSTHKIAKLVADVGNHGVQSVFEKHGLNLYEKRLKFRLKKLVKTPWTALLVWGEELLFLSIPVILLSFVAKLTYDLLSTAPSGFEMVGYLFAETALVVGSFFFLYSLKYYLTVALVLAFSRSGGGNDVNGSGYPNGYRPPPSGSNGSGFSNHFARGANGAPNGNGGRGGLLGRLIRRNPFSTLVWISAKEKREKEGPLLDLESLSPTFKGQGRPPRGLTDPFSTPGVEFSWLNGYGKGNGGHGSDHRDIGIGSGINGYGPLSGGLARGLFGKYLNGGMGPKDRNNTPNGSWNGNGYPPSNGGWMGRLWRRFTGGKTGNYPQNTGPSNGESDIFASKNGLGHGSGNGRNIFRRFLGGRKRENGPNGPFNGLNGKWNGRNGGNGRNGYAEFERGFAEEIRRLKPRVSIHLPLYNEKKVVDRLLEACSHLTYKNYEVVVVDDSDDGTTDIIRGWQDRLVGEGQSNISNHSNISDVSNGEGTPLRQGSAGQVKEYTLPDGTFVREATRLEGSPNPAKPSSTLINPAQPSAFTLKLVHRPTREGFKGGALNHALRVTDPKASYIVVFDADFIPFPDTIEAFLKYFYLLSGGLENVQKGKIAAVQGYQWHILNKDENWITQGVRHEYAGSYVIERSGAELFGTLKQIAGSVYMIRKGILDQFGWGQSITEDFQLTLRLYEEGYKVVYTPYIQAPAECVSTLKRLIRQRMRWAEGHTHNVRLMFKRLLDTPFMATREKLEFIYLSPYYLQAAFLLVGTFFWFVSEIFFRTKLPFWTAVWGWSLVITNFLSLPLMNSAGLFLEEGEKKDYGGLFSFVALTYILAPFQAYASLKGLMEKAEGPWFRTPKTGLITISLARAHFARILRAILPGRGRPAGAGLKMAGEGLGEGLKVEDGRSKIDFEGGRWMVDNLGKKRSALLPSTLYPQLSNFHPLPSIFKVSYPSRRRIRFLGNLALAILLASSLLLGSLAPLIPPILEEKSSGRGFASLASVAQGSTVESEGADGEITGPLAVRYPVGDKAIEYIFHPEPRVRTKYDGKEIELTVLSAEGLGVANPRESLKQGGEYLYQEIFKDTDLRYTPELGKLTEEFIFKGYQDFQSIEYSLRTVDLEVAYRDGEIFFAPQQGGNPLFFYPRPFMYEKQNPAEKSFGIEYVLEKEQFGWKLKKVLTEGGESWLSDPSRLFPVILDPTQVTSIIEDGNILSSEADYCCQQRKIVWANGALNGDAWYVIYNNANNIFYEKCDPNDSAGGCDTNADWTNRTDMDTGSPGNYNPSAWWESDRAKIWVIWASNAADNLIFRDLDVDASDPGTLGTACQGTDQSNHVPSSWITSIAVASDDDIFVSYVDTASGTQNTFYRVAAGTCTFPPNQLSGSGVTAGDYPLLLTIGADAHVIFNDGNLSHSVYVDDASPGWDRSNLTIASNASTTFSAATDGTSIWVLIDQGTTGADLWTCSSCSATASWTDSSDPWSGLSDDIVRVAITYISATTELAALSQRPSAGVANIFTKGTSASSISWGSESDLGNFGATTSGGLSGLSSIMSATADTTAAFVLSDNDNVDYEFSTLPENYLLLLVFAPFLPKVKKILRGCQARETVN